MAKKQVVKVAAIQLDVVYGDVKACVSKVRDWIDKAAEKDVDIALFPELILSGAYYGLCSKSLAYKVAETIHGPSTEVISKKARKRKINVIVGIAEKGRLSVIYDSAVLFNRDGDISGVYRKTHLYPPTEYVFAPGYALPVFQTDFGKIGILICYDLEFPEPARVLVLQGAQIIFALVANWPESVPNPPSRIFETSFASRALENRVPIVIANRVGFDPDLKNSFNGLSRIINHFGEVLAAASADREEMVTATLDLSKIEEDRASDVNNIFRDRRPSLYELICKPID